LLLDSRRLAKSVVSAVAIPKGTVITREMLTTKGPGTGISPMYLTNCVGKKAAKDIEEDVVLYDADLV
jgi:sialic acid synthase SpsE